MDYELAKKLKDAGFAQKGKWYLSSRYVCSNQPTLSELIQACKKPLTLFVYKDKSSASWTELKPFNLPVDGKLSYGYVPSEGKTPEEAVAYLWLELNKPK